MVTKKSNKKEIGKWVDFVGRYEPLEYVSGSSMTYLVEMPATGTESAKYEFTTASVADLTEVSMIVRRTETRLDRIEEKLDRILEKVNDNPDVITDATDADVRTMIFQYIEGKDTFYPSDIAFELNLDYEQVCRVLNDLKNEGKVGDID